jgi:hypothetical protein
LQGDYTRVRRKWRRRRIRRWGRRRGWMGAAGRGG